MVFGIWMFPLMIIISLPLLLLVAPPPQLLLISGAAVDFQDLNLRDSIESARLPTRQPTTASTNPLRVDDTDDHVSEGKRRHHWRLTLLHRDHLTATINEKKENGTGSLRERLESRLLRDAARTAWLTRRLITTAHQYHYSVSDFGSAVVSGMSQGSGEYFVRIGVGSPPRSQYMVIDSGSDIVWVQCRPCAQCYAQSDPVFDPSESASFAGVACASSLCGRLPPDNDAAGCTPAAAGGQRYCRYEVSYGDGSYTKGTLALETLTFFGGGPTVVRDVAIGCGHRNRGLFVGAAGLLGLGGGSLSFVGQLGGQTGGAFAYCLVTRGSGAATTGDLAFGRGALPLGAAWVPLLRNPRAPSFYYVGLSGLGVGGARVPVPEEAFRLTELGDGGVVMDTGTAVTRFPGVAYAALRDAFLAGTSELPRAAGVSIFDTCYDLFGFESVRVPTVSFYFAGGPILTLPARNFLIPVDEVGTFCFAFAPSGSGLSIIGNIQQEGIQVSFDAANGFVGFGPNTC
ncbi:hypothetical protein H6P81_017844 [Aristolochia fimbriata]|uniref:Peptidase A1 domain-containing protein n=1 Tax=Aristolochia fimbriata TaxID=158543 RepID=A0AAV7DZB1_ARIFI|nr:hypothetical protein H6P81_017844 [Aristolochia fimbriata]